jgi:hypothetical protein
MAIVMSKWIEQAAFLLVKHSVLPATELGHLDSSRLLSVLLSEFHNQYKQLSEYDDINDALKDMLTFAEHASNLGVPYGFIRKVGVTVTKHYGDISVTFTQEAEFVVATPAQSRAAFDRLVAVVHHQHDTYQKTNELSSVPRYTAGQGGTAAGAGTNGHKKDEQLVEVDVMKLVHGFENGKHKWRVFCGLWQKWGVPIYDEVLAHAGIQPDNKEFGDIPRAGRASVLVRNGEPVKVISLNPGK